MTEWLNVDEAAGFLRMGRTRLYALTREGRIPASRTGKKWAYEKEALAAWLKGGHGMKEFFIDTPFEIVALPFGDARDTSESSSFELDVYAGCSSGADESGPEVVYRLELAEPRAIRAFVLDRAGVDVDIQLLAIDPLLGVGEDTCLERDDTLVQTTLAAGSYAIVVDTYVAGGIEQAGPYTLVVHECRVDDPDCA